MTARRQAVARSTSVALLVAGCFWPGSTDPFDGRAIQARNESGVPVIFGVEEDGEFRGLPQRDPLAHGQTFTLFSADADSRSIEGGCTIFDVVALGPDGEEVARATPPLCYDDPQPAWVVVPSN